MTHVCSSLQTGTNSVNCINVFIYGVCLWSIAAHVIHINLLHQSLIWQTRPNCLSYLSTLTTQIKQWILSSLLGSALTQGAPARNALLSSCPGIPSFIWSPLERSCSLDRANSAMILNLSLPTSGDSDRPYHGGATRRPELPSRWRRQRRWGPAQWYVAPLAMFCVHHREAICSLSRVIDAGNEVTCVALHYQWNSSTGQGKVKPKMGDRSPLPSDAATSATII